MWRKATGTAMVVLCLLSVSAHASSTVEIQGVETAEFTLSYSDPADAVVALRAIAAVGQVEIIEGATLRVTDTPANLVLVEKVLQMFDLPPGVASAIESYSVVPEDDVIVRFALQCASSQEVMGALREDGGVKTMVVSDDPPLVIIRDTKATGDAAQELVESMERACPDPGASMGD